MTPDQLEFCASSVRIVGGGMMSITPRFQGRGGGGGQSRDWRRGRVGEGEVGLLVKGLATRCGPGAE